MKKNKSKKKLKKKSKKLQLSKLYTKKNYIESQFITYNNCNKSKIYNYIDLNDVKLMKINNKYELIYNNIIFNNIKFINKGSYGNIYELSNNKEDIKIAIKIFNKNTDNEIQVLKNMKKNKIPCNIINSKLFNINNIFFSIMNLLNGPLSKLNGKFNKLGYDNILKIIKNICIHLECLNKNNLSYTDLKTDNILYKCINKENINIYIGDLGGICKKGNNQNACTWLPWEYRYYNGFPECKETTMVWQVGVVILELLKINTKSFYWDNIRIIDENDFLKILENIINNKKFKYITNCKIDIKIFILNIFNLNPLKRYKLKEIINYIN